MTLTTIKPAGLSKPVDLADNEKIRLGTGNDLQIYHDGNSRIQNTNNSCDFRIQSDAIELKANSADEMILKGVKDGAVELYHNNSKKFETTSFGIKVVGMIDTTENIDIDADNHALRIGASQNLQLVFTGSEAIIKNVGATSPIKIKVKDGVEDAIVCNANGETELYYDGSKKFETTSAGTEVSGNLVVGTVTLDGGGLSLSDNDKLKCGNGDDLQLYHDASGPISYIKNTTNGYLYIQDDVGQNIYIRATPNENAAVFKPNGAVELFYDNSKKFETYSAGSLFTGNLKNTNDGANQAIYLGASDDLALYHDGTDSIIQDNRNSGTLRIQADSIGFNDKDVTETMLLATADGSVDLYYDGNKKLETKDNGIIVSNSGDTQLTILADSDDNGGNNWPHIDFRVNNLSGTTQARLKYREDNACLAVDIAGQERVGVNANGLVFNGDTAAANALDDYEEGTWSPGIDRNASSMSVSYSHSTGTYTKIGRLVMVWFDFSVSSGGTSGSGAYYITELPFTALYGSGGGSNNGGYGAPTFRDANLTHSDFRVYGSSSYVQGSQIYLQHYNSSGNTVATTCNGSGRLTGQAFYFAA